MLLLKGLQEGWMLFRRVGVRQNAIKTGQKPRNKCARTSEGCSRLSDLARLQNTLDFKPMFAWDICRIGIGWSSIYVLLQLGSNSKCYIRQIKTNAIQSWLLENLLSSDSKVAKKRKVDSKSKAIFFDCKNLDVRAATVTVHIQVSYWLSRDLVRCYWFK